MKNLAHRAAIGLFAPVLFTTVAVAQSNATGTPPPVIGPRIAPPPPDVDGGCANGFAGTTTIAGGWTAFEAASGQAMTVLTCACADFAPLISIATPCDAAVGLGLSPTHEKRTVGASWGTWSHGYTGEIYWTLGSTTALYTMPPSTDAFDCYIEPNPFAPQSFTVTGTADNGDMAVLMLASVSGASGATHFGFWVDAPCNLSTISVSSTADFAIGEARISCKEAGPCLKVCQSNPTSVGPGASIEYKGEVAPGVHRFSAEPVPNDNGIFFHGATLIRVPFGHGFLCAGGGLVRVLPPVLAMGNRAEKDVAIPPGMGLRYWQYWFRDPAAGGPAFNTTNALCCVFIP